MLSKHLVSGSVSSESEGLDITLGLLGFLGSVVAAIGTLEILHYVKEKIRLAKQRKESLPEYEHYRRLAD